MRPKTRNGQSSESIEEYQGVLRSARCRNNCSPADLYCQSLNEPGYPCPIVSKAEKTQSEFLEVTEMETADISGGRKHIY